MPNYKMKQCNQCGAQFGYTPPTDECRSCGELALFISTDLYKMIEEWRDWLEDHELHETIVAFIEENPDVLVTIDWTPDDDEMPIIRMSPIEVKDGYLSFRCTSDLYGYTDAGGKALDALKRGFVSLGDGCDYRLSPEEKTVIGEQLGTTENPNAFGGKTAIIKKFAEENGIGIHEFRLDSGCDESGSIGPDDWPDHASHDPRKPDPVYKSKMDFETEVLDSDRGLRRMGGIRDEHHVMKTFVVTIEYHFDCSPENKKRATFELRACQSGGAEHTALKKWPNSRIISCKEKTDG